MFCILKWREYYFFSIFLILTKFGKLILNSLYQFRFKLKIYFFKQLLKSPVKHEWNIKKKEIIHIFIINFFVKKIKSAQVNEILSLKLNNNMFC